MDDIEAMDLMAVQAELRSTTEVVSTARSTWSGGNGFGGGSTC